MVWFVDAAIHLGLFIAGRAKLTTAKIEAARAAGAVECAGDPGHGVTAPVLEAGAWQAQ